MISKLFYGAQTTTFFIFLLLLDFVSIFQGKESEIFPRPPTPFSQVNHSLSKTYDFILPWWKWIAWFCHIISMTMPKIFSLQSEYADGKNCLFHEWQNRKIFNLEFCSFLGSKQISTTSHESSLRARYKSSPPFIGPSPPSNGIISPTFRDLVVFFSPHSYIQKQT